MQFAHIANMDETIIVPRFSLRSGIVFNMTSCAANEKIGFVEVHVKIITKVYLIQFIGIRKDFIVSKEPDLNSSSFDLKFLP